jgi:tetratricopeptide (TPR) repeat protein
MAAVLGVVTCAVFSPALANQFVNFDDYTYVYRNEHVLHGLSAENVRWAFTTYQAANWHPLTWLSLQLDASLWDAGPMGFHGTSVFLHGLNAALLFLALQALTGAYWRSAVVALLFALHPLRVESVAWISERKDVLSTCFGLLALLAYAGYARVPNAMRYLTVFVALALSLLCKPMLVTLPFLLLLLDWWPLARGLSRRDWLRLTIEKVPLFLLVAASCAITYRAQSKEGAVMDLEDSPPIVRVANATISYATYLGKTAWPLNLAAYYPHPGTALRVLPFVAAGLLLVALTIAAVALRQRAPYLLAGWLWFLGTLVPVIGLIQVGLQAYADRYTYFPQIGLLLALSWGVADLVQDRGLEWKRAAGTLAGVTAVVLAALTVQQIGVWHDSLTLWRHSLSVVRSATGLANLAETLEQSGEVTKAAALYREALALSPKSAQGYINLGNNLEKQGQLDEAAKQFRKVCELMPDSPIGHTNLGEIYKKQGKLDQAAAEFAKACAAAPDDPERFLNAGKLEEDRHDYKRAAEFYGTALRLQPSSYFANFGLGVVLFQQGREEDGLDHLRTALRINPDFVKAHTELGKALVKRKDLTGAIWHFERATQLEPKSSIVWYHLGLVRGMQGNPVEAANCFATAFELDRKSEAVRKALEGTLKLLRANGLVEQANQIERRVHHLLGN